MRLEPDIEVRVLSFPPVAGSRLIGIGRRKVNTVNLYRIYFERIATKYLSVGVWLVVSLAERYGRPNTFKEG